MILLLVYVLVVYHVVWWGMIYFLYFVGEFVSWIYWNWSLLGVLELASCYGWNLNSPLIWLLIRIVHVHSIVRLFYLAWLVYILELILFCMSWSIVENSCKLVGDRDLDGGWFLNQGGLLGLACDYLTPWFGSSLGDCQILCVVSYYNFLHSMLILRICRYKGIPKEFPWWGITWASKNVKL